MDIGATPKNRHGIQHRHDTADFSTWNHEYGVLQPGEGVIVKILVG